MRSRSRSLWLKAICSVSIAPPATYESGHFYFAQTGHSHFAATTRKHALTKVGLFTSMSRLPGVRGMLGASQVVNVVLSNSADVVLSLSALPLPCSLPCDSNAASFASFCLRHPQVDFYVARGKSLHRLEAMGAVNQLTIHGNRR